MSIKKYELDLANDLQREKLPIKTVNNQYPDENGNISLITVPTGAEMNFYCNTAPDGFFVCDGSAIRRTTYANLFAKIGTLYGAGDGSTTFNLPNRISYPYAKGVSASNVGTKYDAGLPNITGTFTASDYGFTYSGAFYKSAGGNGIPDKSGGGATVGFDASRVNGIYSKSDTVQPPSLGILPCIKY